MRQVPRAVAAPAGALDGATNGLQLRELHEPLGLLHKLRLPILFFAPAAVRVRVVLNHIFPDVRHAERMTGRHTIIVRHAHASCGCRHRVNVGLLFDSGKGRGGRKRIAIYFAKEH
jgi:hypothetical protein